jgi:hypothetical protein
MPFKFINCFLAWYKGFDIFLLELRDDFLDMPNDDLDDGEDRTVAVRTEGSVDHCVVLRCAEMWKSAY